MVFRKNKEYQAQLLSSNKIYENLIKDDDVFEKILKVFDFNFIYDEVEHLYCTDNGRPAEDPVKLYKATLVQRLKGLSDPEMEDVARFDIRIKHFLGIGIQDFGFDYSTLSRFRTRLGPQLFERIFQKILEQIVELGIIKNSKQQYIDSMPVLAHAALPSVTCLIYQAIKNVIKTLDKSIIDRIFEKTGLNNQKLLHYTKPRPLFKLEKAERKSAFEKSVNRSRDIIFLLESENYQSDELNLLKQILAENVDSSDNQKFSTKPIITLTDKDAKLGHKSKKDKIFGYKNHSTVTEEGIITAVETTSASEKDDKQTDILISKQEEVNLKPSEMDADSGYGYIETFKAAKEKNVKLNAPLRGFNEKELSIYELKYDKNSNTITCLNYITVQGKGQNGLLFKFPIRKCRDCPRKKQCPLPASKLIRLHPEHEIARETIERQRIISKERKLAKENGIKTKSRLIIENVYAFLEKLGGKKTPYFGLEKTSIHVLLVVTMSNIMKTIRLIP